MEGDEPGDFMCASSHADFLGYSTVGSDGCIALVLTHRLILKLYPFNRDPTEIYWEPRGLSNIEYL